MAAMWETGDRDQEVVHVTTPSTPARGPMSSTPGTQSDLPRGPAGTTGTPNTATMTNARPTVAVGTYPDYASAQRAVDYLSDNQFPVERTSIVGTDLHLVEQVLGRMTTGRAALAGAGGGAWFGLFIGLLFAIFTYGAWLAVLIAAVIIGAIWGAIFGAIAHGMTGGRRDFTSQSTLQASQYAVCIDAEFADQARETLSRMNLQPGSAGR